MEGQRTQFVENFVKILPGIPPSPLLTVSFPIPALYFVLVFESVLRLQATHDYNMLCSTRLLPPLYTPGAYILKCQSSAS